MNSWQEDVLNTIDGISCHREVFGKITDAARSLGFEHCAYGMRVPLPLSNPRTVMLNNYPVAWQERYAQCGYLNIDPTVSLGRRTVVPIIWSDSVFEPAWNMWGEARDHGLRVGWAQSSFEARGIGGMLTLARSQGELSTSELAGNEFKMRWLVSVSHLGLSRLLAPPLPDDEKSRLTRRETEVLKWTADGKTSGEISDLLAVSENTVNFHVKNAVRKLQVANKTSAVVKAAMLGLLYA